MDINTSLTRTLLIEAHKEVKKHFPNINLKSKQFWVYGYGNRGHKQSWEFHGPNGFYWHGRASDAFDARSKGWMSWLEKMGKLS